ncbi:MAG: hypothetical protein LBG90_08195 [Spirochaetaceae bacterium]|jgi:hypothetical protein|nr:hypothetical protein [Spirochaetaceae bacterium]
MKIGIRRGLLVSALSVLAFPLFASAVQEKELDDLLALKRVSSQEKAGANGVSQTVDGQFIEFSKGDLTIRVPLDAGLENADRFIAMLAGGFSGEALAGKWLVSDAEESTGYLSFEFDRDTFIAVQAPPPDGDRNIVYTGLYKIAQNEVILPDFGVLRNITLTDGTQGELEFYFSPIASEEYTEIRLKSQKAETFDSNRTLLLCKTWKLAKRDGQETQNTQYEETILFTNAGTYLVSYPDGEFGLAKWRWNNADESAFEYSWNEDWNESGIGLIQQLTQTSFTVKDKADVIYEFIPGDGM